MTSDTTDEEIIGFMTPYAIVHLHSSSFRIACTGYRGTPDVAAVPADAIALKRTKRLCCIVVAVTGFTANLPKRYMRGMREINIFRLTRIYIPGYLCPLREVLFDKDTLIFRFTDLSAVAHLTGCVFRYSVEPTVRLNVMAITAGHSGKIGMCHVAETKRLFDRLVHQRREDQPAEDKRGDQSAEKEYYTVIHYSYILQVA
jgi:hypothetical protein